MKILSWNLGLTNDYYRYYAMGITNHKPISIYIISKFLLKTTETHNEEVDYDILFLQEVYDGFEQLKDNIIHKYPYYTYIDSIGIAIFSKYKLENICYKTFNQDLLNYIMGVNNGFMMCYLPEFKTYLCNAHFSCDINICKSNSEFIKLNEYLDTVKLKDDETIIYGGDLNIRRDIFINYCNKLDITQNDKNIYNSYYYIYPMNLDYLLCKTNTSNKELKCNTKNIYESDHLPIIASF
jgi:exonuclease III